MTKHRLPGVHVLEYQNIAEPHVEGSNDAWWGVAKMYVKAQDHDAKYLLANELICCRLAAALGLPVLPGEIAQHPDGRKCWVTPQISLSDVSLPPTDLDRMMAAQPGVVAGTVVFDCWVRNDDRTADNLLFDPRLGIWLIDHEHCLAGRTGESFGELRRVVDEQPGWSDFRDRTIDTSAIEYWTMRVRSLPITPVEQALEEAFLRGLINRAQQAELKTFLLARKEKIDTLVKTFVSAPPSMEPSVGGLFDEGGA
ncbi:hypothetical protein [Rhodococcus sp. IEGM1428]|uniref:hypothetical protein n=1 Tax=Rhodococcus sp. IEGM1428 TaxID=3392191 RepID=UPI003D0D74B8